MIQRLKGEGKGSVTAMGLLGFVYTNLNKQDQAATKFEQIQMMDKNNLIGKVGFIALFKIIENRR